MEKDVAISGGYHKVEAGAGCLSFIIGLMIMAGEVLLLSGELFGDLADNGIAWVCACWRLSLTLEL